MPDTNKEQSFTGFLCALTAYLIWGLSPIYFKALGHVPPFEILMHRVIWSLVFLAPLLLIFKKWNAFISALKNIRILFILLLSTSLVACNWFLFIWAINNNHILQTSLGYYINPLFSVILGMIFLKERLRRLQIAAAIIALSGVLYLTVVHGQFPWVALTLAVTFGFYGLIKKTAPVDALTGLTIETLLLSGPALVYLFYIDANGVGTFLHSNFRTDLLLIGTTLVTAPPLLFFTMGARRLTLITIGFMQYIAPSSTFLLAVFIYNEPFKEAQAFTFGMIWIALAIFSIDAVLYYKRRISI